MAVSAFRSTSRRGNSSSMGEEEGKKRGSNRGRAEDKATLPTRRSRSVSAAIPRNRSSRGTTITDNASAPPISSSSSAANHLLHFDNPLFASHHPPTRTPPPTNTTNNTTLAPDDSRGRSMARTSFSYSSSSAPSLSHTRSRGRSASRPPSRRYSHEVPFPFFPPLSHSLYMYPYSSLHSSFSRSSCLIFFLYIFYIFFLFFSL